MPISCLALQKYAICLRSHKLQHGNQTVLGSVLSCIQLLCKARNASACWTEELWDVAAWARSKLSHGCSRRTVTLRSHQSLVFDLKWKAPMGMYESSIYIYIVCLLIYYSRRNVFKIMTSRCSLFAEQRSWLWKWGSFVWKCLRRWKRNLNACLLR